MRTINQVPLILKYKQSTNVRIVTHTRRVKVPQVNNEEKSSVIWKAVTGVQMEKRVPVSVALLINFWPVSQ